jgi:hypothetical protein
VYSTIYQKLIHDMSFKLINSNIQQQFHLSFCLCYTSSIYAIIGSSNINFAGSQERRMWLHMSWDNGLYKNLLVLHVFVSREYKLSSLKFRYIHLALFSSSENLKQLQMRAYNNEFISRKIHVSLQSIYKFDCAET